MTASGEYWYCVQHRRVEGPDGCYVGDRLGPYPTHAAAERALETVRERNRAWDEADDDWGQPPADP